VSDETFNRLGRILGILMLCPVLLFLWALFGWMIGYILGVIE